MAWISVHEQVIGGKLRNLAKELGCSQNEALGILVRMWLWGINNADKEGRIIGADKADVAEVLTIGIDARYSPEDAVNALVKTEWIDIDEGYLFIHDWEEWQEQWYKAIEVREKNAERKRRERSAKRNLLASTPKAPEPVQEKVQESILPTPKLNIPPLEEQKKQTENTDYPDDFKKFWDIYPRKEGKGEAYKKYKARINNGWKPEELIMAAENYASKLARERTEKKYIKHPKTFLSDTEPFTDYLPKKEAVQETNEDDPYANWR